MSEYTIPVINPIGINYNSLIREPDTVNTMLNTNFKFSLSRIPNVQFWCTSVNIPSITIGEIAVPNRFISLHVPGSSIQLDQLRVSFLLDEEFSNWNEINKWMHSIVPFEDFTEILNNESLYYSDITIHCLNSAKNPNLKFTFKKAFPVLLDGFDLNVALNEPEPISVNATFAFESFAMEKVT